MRNKNQEIVIRVVVAPEGAASSRSGRSVSGRSAAKRAATAPMPAMGWQKLRSVAAAVDRAETADEAVAALWTLMPKGTRYKTLERIIGRIIALQSGAK